MNFIRYLGISAIAAIMTFLVLTATSRTAHAASCGYQIYAGQTIHVDQGCRVSGDVVVDNMRQYDDLYWTGLVVDIQEPGGSSVYAPSGASVSIRTMSDIRDDLLRNGCGSACSSVYTQTWYGPQSGYGQYSPAAPVPVSPPVVQPAPTTISFAPGATVSGTIYYSNGSLYCWNCGPFVVSFYGYVYVGSGNVTPAPVAYPQAPTYNPGIQSFGNYDRVIGGIIFLNGSHYCDAPCAIDVYGGSGYVIGGTVYHAYNAPTTVSPTPAPVTLDGRPRAVFDNWSRFAKGDSATGYTLVFDDGRVCTNWCYSTNASIAGYVYSPNGGQVIIHPYQSDVYGRTMIN